MQKLTSSQRKYLRGLAHNLKPVVKIGNKGLSENLIKSMDEALTQHELIKVKFDEFKEKKEELVKILEKKNRAGIVGMIGNVAIFYRQHPDEEKRRINLT